MATKKPLALLLKKRILRYMDLAALIVSLSAGGFYQRVGNFPELANIPQAFGYECPVATQRWMRARDSKVEGEPNEVTLLLMCSTDKTEQPTYCYELELTYAPGTIFTASPCAESYP